MTRSTLLALAAFVLTACDGGSSRPRPTPDPIVRADPAAAASWEIGPVVRGDNVSVGVALHPTRTAEGLAIDLPQAPGHIHAVTFRHGPLTGKRRIVMRFQLEAATGTHLAPRSDPLAPSILALYFQRKGDDWSARGSFEAFRWYAAFSFVSPVEVGDYELAVPLDGEWTAVLTSKASTNPAGFKAAIDNADRVGFVLGGGTGLGHGVYATGPARLIIKSFVVE